MPDLPPEEAGDLGDGGLKQLGKVGYDLIKVLDDTIRFLAERYPELTPEDLEQLKATGLRFCQPVIPHGSQSTSADNLEDANAA